MTNNKSSQQTTTLTIRPFEVAIPQDASSTTCRPASSAPASRPSSPGDGWEQGTPVDYLRDMVDHWRTGVRLARSRRRG